MKRPIETLSGVARALAAVLAVALCTSVASAGGKGSNQVREIKVSQQGGQTVVTVVGSARPTFTAFKLSTPKRLVVDLADTQVRGVPSVVEASTELISGVAVSQYTSGGTAVSRVMVNFRKEAAYRVRAQGNDLVITLTGGPVKPEEPAEIEVGNPAVDAALAQAHTEAAEARLELSKVKDEAAQANDRFAAAKRKLGEIEDEAKRYKQEAEQARREADEAREVLEKAREVAAVKEKQQTRSAAKAEKRAATEVAAMRAEIARAKKLIEAEQAKRRRLEKRLDQLKGDLAVASKAKDAAEGARKEAEARAEELKQQTQRSAATAEEAKQEAEAAVAAQRRAATALERAAEGERAALLKILEQKERETVVARQRLATAVSKEKENDDRLDAAMKELRQASSEARKAAKAKSRVESVTRRELARAESARRKAEDAAERARKRAEIATAAKAAAEQEVERIRSEAASRTTKAERRAADRVAEAEQKLARAERARKSARGKLDAVVDRLKRAEGDVAKAEERAASYEKELKQYKYKDRKAMERLAKMKDELQWAKWRAGRAEEHAQALQKELRSEVRQARKQAESYEKQLADVKRGAERASKRAARYSKELEDFKSTAGKKAKRGSGYERKLKQLEDKVRRAERRAATYEEKIASARHDAEEYETRIATYESQLAEVRAEAELAEKQAKHALAAQARAAKEYMRAAESEKAELLKVLQEKEQEATEAQERLSQAKRTISEQEQRAAEPTEVAGGGAAEPAAKPVVKTAAAPAGEKQTQEELRLQRLAEMHGEKAARRQATSAPAEAPRRAAAQPMITDIEFRSDGDVQKVIVRLNGDVEYSKSTNADGSSELVFRGVGLGPMLERTLDVTDFGGAIESVSSYRDGDTVKVDVEVGQLSRNQIVRKQRSIEWVFTPRRHGKSEPSALAAAKKAPRKGTESRTVAREDDSAYEYPMDRTAAYAVQLKSYGKKKKRYSGRRIDLDFKDADIHNILRLLADVGHVNIVTADDVGGTVTIRMRNVPWDHALDVILQAKHLGMVREGNLIRVAPLATLEKEREMEIARRKQNQALEPLETRLIPVSYAQAGELKPRADDLLSDRGKLSVDDRTNVIIARDVATNLDQIEALIRNLDTQTPQVLIEGRIVEASSTYAREIGIQWGGDFSASTATANPTGLAFPSTVGVAGGATDSQTPAMGLSPVAGARPNPNFAVNLPASVGTGSGGALGITLGSITNNANLNFRLSALEEEGTLRILSSPKILTLDNREAHIEQGTLIPYSRISAQGIQTSFKEAKLNLTVTPHVTADGSVLLSIKMTRDEPDFNNKGARGDPTILKREAETELLVSDGHTAVIGGIYTRNHGTSYKKVPFFGDIPILGWLFKSRTDSDRRSEMLIFITPRIVNRAESIGQ